MPKKPVAKMRPDIAEIAYRTMMEATGQAPKTLPPSERSKADRNPDAVARGSKGGRKGGPARAAKLSPRKRQKIGKKAAKARWGKLKP